MKGKNQNRFYRWEAALLAGILVSLLTGAAASFALHSETLRGGVLRLHILANSDTAEDQRIKLEVRDAILAVYGGELAESTGRAQAEARALALLERIEGTARGVVRENGSDDSVKAALVHMYFDTRTYDGVTLPAGMYDAVRVTIGDARGRNWWCVLYPPVCLPAAEGRESLVEDSVAGADPKFEPRFKIVEWLESWKQDDESPDEPSGAVPDLEPDGDKRDGNSI